MNQGTFYLLTLCTAALLSGAQAPSQAPPMPEQGSMMHSHMAPTAASPSPESLAPAVPDLLTEIAGRPPMRLEDFQQLALALNPGLRQAKAIVAQSAAQARQAGLPPNPSAGYQGEQIRGGAYGGGEQGGYVQQTFVLGGKLALRRNVYEQQRLADQTGVNEQNFRVLNDIGQSFYAALAAQESVAVRKRLLSLAMDAVLTAHQLANVGQADAPDVLQAEVEGEGAKIEYTNAQRAYLQSFRSLAALTGKPELPLTSVAGSLEHPPELNTATLIDQIVSGSPAVKRAQQEVLRAEAEWKSARREAVPDLQIRAGVQQNNERLNDGSPRQVGVQAFTTAGITLPLFNRNGGNIAAAQLGVERAEAEVARVQLSLRMNAQSVVQSYLSSQLQAARYREEMIPRATRAYQLYLAKYQNMAAAYPQVLVSQRTLFQLQIAYIAALQSLWTNAISLQNYLLSSGLGEVNSSGSPATTLNLPNGSGGGAQ